MAFTAYLDTGKSFSIKNFKSQFKDGVAKPSLFHFKLKRYPRCFFDRSTSINTFLNKVGIDTPDILSKAINYGETIYENINNRSLSDLVFKVHRATLPNRLINSYSAKVYGPSTDFPRDIENGYFSISIYTSGTYWEHNLFSQWQSAIINYGDPVDSNYNVTYYDDIISEAQIIAYNEMGEPTYLMSLDEIWPKNVGGISFDWGNKNNNISFNVDLHYRIVKIEKIALSAQIKNNDVNRLRTFFNTLDIQDYVT